MITSRNRHSVIHRAVGTGLKGLEQGLRGVAIEPSRDLHGIVTRATSEIQVTGPFMVGMHG